MDNRIIGNGLLANVFKMSESKDCIFFCSGVSNSAEVNANAFEREKRLLIETLKTQGESCFVYFSSIQSPSKSNPYYQHKFDIEKYIIKHSKKYLILRLPQVAGTTINNTLFPFFISSIHNNRELKIHKNSKRSVIDVEDVLNGFDILHRKKIKNHVLNFCPNFSFKPEEIATAIACYLGVKLRCKYIEGGTEQSCVSSEHVEKLNLFTDKDTYLKDLVRKYTDKIISQEIISG